MTNEKKVQRPITVKTINHTLKLNSSMLVDYLEYEGDKSIGALSRVGSLLRMLQKEQTLSATLQVWFDGVFNEAEKEIVDLVAQKKVFLEGMEIDMPTANIPDNFKYEINITHPSIWKFIRLLEKVDSQLDEMEVMWLSGAVTDDELSHVRNQALAIIRRTIHKIFEGTSPGKRDGAKFSPVKFINVIRNEKGVPEKKIPELIEGKVVVDVDVDVAEVTDTKQKKSTNSKVAVVADFSKENETEVKVG